MKTIELKLNQPMRGYGAGRIVTIQTDVNGLPLEKFWRRRLKDAEIDNCVAVVEPTPAKSKKERAK